MPPQTNPNQKNTNPSAEQAVPANLAEQKQPQTGLPEKQPQRVEQAPKPASGEAQPTTQTTPAPPPNQTVLPQTPVATTTAAATSSDDPVASVIQAKTANLAADDVNLIEKEWVEVVDDTIAKTQDDPEIEERAQQELNRAYLKKRFNLDVDPDSGVKQ